MQKRSMLLTLLFLTSQIFAQLVTDPLPYAKIAVQIPDTMDQLYRDSINLKFSPIRINQAGYRPQDDKFFYYVAYSAKPSAFKVIDYSTGAEVGSGTLTATSYKTSGQLHIRASNNAQIRGGGDTRYEMDSKTFEGPIYEGKLPDLNPGTYKVVVGSDTSVRFTVDSQLYGWVRDALIKFYGINRCGDDNSWFHKDCHMLDAVTGGWHDCGDHLKEGLTMGHTAAVLGLCAAVFQDRDHDAYAANQGLTRTTDGIPDILYEAKHGADFILRSYDKAGGEVSKMVTSVGNFGHDHNWWGRPEFQDKMPEVRGGPVRDARVELGGNILGNYAANLACVSKVIRPYNSDYADRCLKAAKDIYAYAKAHKEDASSSPAYSGNDKTYDKLALAAATLIYATGDKSYLNDLCYDKTIGINYDATFPKFSYEGGWFAYDNKNFEHYLANTDWASVQMYASWGFFRLVLMDEALCKSLDLTDAQRFALIEKTAYSIMMNLGEIGNSTGELITTLPSAGGWVPSDVKAEMPWFTMHTQQEWVWNRYQAGNITDMFCYYDMATRVQGMELPNTPASTDWKAETIKKTLIRQLDYMLGVNPWDISMIYGVGAKNFNHPHHRAANPEGKNVPGAFYKYIPPVGALQGGYKPVAAAANAYSEFWGEYHNSETGIDGTSALFLPVVGLAKEEPITNPTGSVSITYVGCDNAIVEVKQSRYGNASIHYGTDGNTSQVLTSDSAAVTHRFELTGLKNGTIYSFYVKVSDLFGRDSVIMNLDEDKKLVNFDFKTLANCPTNAEITKVKICSVTSDSAEIFWYTPNGAFDSKVVYGESKPPTTVQNGDVSGHPAKLHYVKIGGLKEKTTYYFYVQSGESVDNNSGAYYKFTTPVEHVEFDLRAVRYDWDGMPSMGLGIINQDIKSYDSLDIRLYFRAKEGFENDLAARLDIIIRYREDGFQDSVTGDLKRQIWDNLYKQKATKIEDTYNEKDDTYAYYFSIPMWGLEMKSGSRIRIDMVFDTWEKERLKDHLNEPPEHVISDADWSFGPHSVANGDPYDFPGVPVVKEKDDIDNNYWNLPIDHYICVYRKGEFVWGYSPSQEEMETKKTQYTIESRITSPVNNPTQTDTTLAQVSKSITLRGFAKITPVDGKVNDVWLNGVPVSDLPSVVTWNKSEQRYEYAIPATLKSEFNEFDVTVFAGPDETCTECYGCANYNHHFNVHYIGAKQYPSTLTLKDADMQNLPDDTAHIDTTEFNVIVTDRNGNLHGKSVDTVFIWVKNPALEDSARIALIETGDSTSTFQTKNPIFVTDKSALDTRGNEIGMSGGDKIWITYIDVNDSSDISEATLVSKADFPVASDGAYFDSNGDGKVDKMVIRYNIPLTKIVPDSANFSLPTTQDIHILRKGTDTFEADGNILNITFATPLDFGVTSFATGTKGTAKSYLQNAGNTKVTAFDLFDSTGPVISKDVILYEKIGSGDDTLTVTFSETIILDVNTEGVLMLKHGDAESKVTVKGIIDQTGNTMKIVVRTADGISEGDSLFINSSGTLTDMAKNHAHVNNPKQVISLKEAAPSLESAYYTADENGLLDKTVIKFVKKVDPKAITVKISWNNGKEITVDKSKISSFSEDGAIVKVDIKKLLTDKIATSGEMKLSVVHEKFPDKEMKSTAIDKAGPVVTGAVLKPSGTKADGGKYIDTLTVEFSEDVENVNGEQPFTFKNMPDGDVYSMEMENSFKSSEASKQVFYVSKYIDIEFPGKNDSIRINTDVKISDKNGNVQSFENNHFALMVSKQIPFTVTVKSGPNPFKPVTGNDNVDSYDDALAMAKDGKGILILFTPDTSRIKSEVELGGSIDIKIFDGMGHVVRNEKCVSSENKSNVYFYWDGRNRNGRLVGSGTYLVKIKVANKGDIQAEEVPDFKISVKR